MLNSSDVRCLEALAVDNGWAALVVLLLGDPHLLEGGEGSQDGASDPDRVLPLWWSNNLDLHGGGSERRDLLLHPVSNAWVHCGASRQHSVGVQVLPDVHVALHDRVVGGLMDTTRLHAQEAGLEESLGAPEPLVADGDHLAVGQLVGLLQRAGGGGRGHLLLEIKGNITEFLLDVSDDLPLSSGGEAVSSLSENLHQIVGEVTASKVESEDGVGKGVTFIDGDCVGDTVAGIEDDASGTAGGVQVEHGLDGDVHGRGVEGLEHDLGHLLSVGLGVEGSFSEENWVLLRSDTELVVESVVPDLLHVVPVGHDSVLDGILQGEDSSLGLGLVSDIGVLLSHTNHHALMSWSAHNRGEDSSRSIVSGETGLAHAGAVVDNEGSNFIIHGESGFLDLLKRYRRCGVQSQTPHVLC